MNFKSKILLATLLLPFFGVAQKDTIFFNKEWKAIEVKNDASFFRIVDKTDSGFLRKDYYITGELQNHGLFKDAELKVCVGKDVYFNKVGKITQFRNYKNGKLNGFHIRYDSLGVINYSQNYKMDVKEGAFLDFDPIVGYTEEGSFLHGKLFGRYVKKDEYGTVRRLENYENGTWLSGKCFNVDGIEIPFFYEDIEAEFSSMSVSKWLALNIVYPEDALKSDVEGYVRVMFIIDSHGKVIDAKVDKMEVYRVIKSGKRKNKTKRIEISEDASEAISLSEEAVLRISKMPNWTPGMHELKPIRSRFMVRVNFVLT
jgi:hypothetical protein